MGANDVHTSNHGHLWENTVEGRPSLTWGFPDEEQAIRNGEFVAATLGTCHIVEHSGETPPPPDPANESG